MQTLPKQGNSTTKEIYVVEREYLGRYSTEEFVRRIVRSHLQDKSEENQDSQIMEL